MLWQLIGDREAHALKNSRNLGISLADSSEFICLPCFSERFCKISLAPASRKNKYPVSMRGSLPVLVAKSLPLHGYMFKVFKQMEIIYKMNNRRTST